MLASYVRRERKVTSSLTSSPISTVHGAMDAGQYTGYGQLVLPPSAGSLSPSLLSTLFGILSLFISLEPISLSLQSQTHGQPQAPAREVRFTARAGRGELRDAKMKGASFIHRETPPLSMDEEHDQAVRRHRRSVVLWPAHRRFWVPAGSTRSPRRNGVLNSR